MEYLDQILTDEGPYIFQLTEDLKQNLANVDEDQVESLAQFWMSCQVIEELAFKVGVVVLQPCAESHGIEVVAKIIEIRQ